MVSEEGKQASRPKCCTLAMPVPCALRPRGTPSTRTAGLAVPARDLVKRHTIISFPKPGFQVDIIIILLLLLLLLLLFYPLPLHLLKTAFPVFIL